MVKLKFETALDFVADAREWNPEFTENNKPTQYPCIAVIEITPGTMTQEVIHITYVYLSDFDGMRMNLKLNTF